MRLTTAANAILLQYTAPVYVALLSGWLAREKATWLDWLNIGAVLGGLALFFLRKQKSGSPVEPILNPLWVFLLMGEFPGRWAALGGAIVFVAVTLRGVLAALLPQAAAAP